jgi:hypothetical protein
MERRNKSRLYVELNCRINADRVEAAPVTTFTENVSRTGILMRWTRSVPLPEVEARLTVDIPLPETSGFGPRVMRCSTIVVRVIENATEEHEVALRISSMKFVKVGPTVRPRDLAGMPLSTDRVN